MEELRQKIENANSLEELEALKLELKSLEDNAEEAKVEENPEVVEEEVKEPEIEKPEEESKEDDTVLTEEEERSLMNTLEDVKVDTKNLKEIRKEEKKMEERKYSDQEYRSAWAKLTMGLGEDKLTEEEKRAVGDAVTTTATTFVQADGGHNGINNGGLFIPKSVRMELMEIIEHMSPFFRDIRKLQVNGNVDLPYLFASDDANWYVELNDTVNEGAEYKNLQLTGWELAKDVVITWKAEEMAVESFISFILEELAHKMGVALINAVLYGDGSNKPTGVLNGLSAVTSGETPIDTIIATYKSLSNDARVGAKAYVSTGVRISMVGYQDDNGNYPFLQGLAGTDLFSIETDPFLKDYDILVGNPRYYILNENTPVRIDREASVKGRKVTYGAYGIYDGKAKPNAFAKGTYIGSKSL